MHLKTFAAADLTRHTGDLFEAATRAPVAITRHRKPRFVVMSVDHYEALVSGSEQKSYAMNDLPEEHGKLLDAGIAKHLGDE